MKISSWLNIMGSLILVLCAMLTSGIKSVYSRQDAISLKRLFRPSLSQYQRSRSNSIATNFYSRLVQYKPYYKHSNTKVDDFSTINKPSCAKFECTPTKSCCRGMVCVGLGGSTRNMCIRLPVQY